MLFIIVLEQLRPLEFNIFQKQFCLHFRSQFLSGGFIHLRHWFYPSWKLTYQLSLLVKGQFSQASQLFSSNWSHVILLWHLTWGMKTLWTVFTPSLTVNRIKPVSLLISSASLKAGLDHIKWVPAMFLRLVEVTDITRKSLQHLLDNVFPSLATVYLHCVG